VQASGKSKVPRGSRCNDSLGKHTLKRGHASTECWKIQMLEKRMFINDRKFIM
jgi:hypothetical protein